jgi:hypothetical protein
MQEDRRRGERFLHPLSTACLGRIGLSASLQWLAVLPRHAPRQSKQRRHGG